MTLDAETLIALLGMKPHPEGGHYAEVFRDADTDETGRARSSAIYFLLRQGERSHWHRIDAVEVWHHYAGAPIRLAIETDGGTAQDHVLGPDIAQGQRPQIVVPAGRWQSACSLGLWTLAGCTVAPGFMFSGFELAEPGFDLVRR